MRTSLTSRPMRAAGIILLTLLAFAGMRVTAAHADSTYQALDCSGSNLGRSTTYKNDVSNNAGTGSVAVGNCGINPAGEGTYIAASNGSYADRLTTTWTAPANLAFTAFNFSNFEWGAADSEQWEDSVYDGSNTVWHAADTTTSAGPGTIAWSGSGVSAISDSAICDDVGQSPIGCNGGASFTYSNLEVTLDDPNTTPTVSLSGVPSGWIAGSTGDTLSFSASDDAGVCDAQASITGPQTLTHTAVAQTPATNGGAYESELPCGSGGSTGTYTWSPSLSSIASGTYTVAATAQNPGNYLAGSSTYGSSTAYTLEVDNSSPTVAINWSGSSSGWHGTTGSVPAINLSASESYSGVQKIVCTNALQQRQLHRQRQ